jgi:integrase
VSGPMYLYRRASGIYFVRLCVPSRLKAAVGKGELHRSTGCRDHRLAKIVAAELVAHWHRAIEALKHMDIQKLQAGSVKLLGDGYIRLLDAAQECGTTPDSLAERLHERGSALFVLAKGWLGWLTEDVYDDFDHMRDDVTGNIVEVVIDGSRLGGIEAMRPFSGHLSIRFADELSEVLLGSAGSAQMCLFMLWPSVSRAFVCDLPGQEIELTHLLVRRNDVTSIISQLLGLLPAVVVTPPSPSSTGTKATSDSEKFSSLCKRYFDHNADLWTKIDHRRRKEDHTRMFLQLVGDLPIAEIERKAMRDFAETIKDLPAERSKLATEFDLVAPSFLQLIELKRRHGRPGLSEGERRKILDTLAQIFNWAVIERDMTDNPADKLGSEAVRKAGKRVTKAHEQRLQLTPEDLSKVFSADWFASGAGKPTVKGTFYSYRPHYYWLPVMALYCGGRLNELSQLYLKDVTVHQSVHCLDFNLLGDGKIELDETDAPDATDKSLKNIRSARLVPIPQLLIDLGLIAYVERLRELGYTRLFPELTHDAEKGYGKYAGKWFNDSLLGKKLGIPRNGKKTFHSMRHNFATALGALRAEPSQKSDLMGHRRTGSTTEVRYDKGVFENHKLLMDQITHQHPKIHPFNVELGVQALKDALTLKTSRVGKGIEPISARPAL